MGWCRTLLKHPISSSFFSSISMNTFSKYASFDIRFHKNQESFAIFCKPSYQGFEMSGFLNNFSMWIWSEIILWLKFGHFTYWILAQSRTEFNLSKEPCDAWEQRNLQKSSEFLQSFLFQFYNQQVIWFKLNRF